MNSHIKVCQTKNTFLNSLAIRIPLHEMESKISCPSFHNKLKPVAWDLKARNHVRIYGEIWFCISKKLQKLMAFFGIVKLSVNQRQPNIMSIWTKNLLQTEHHRVRPWWKKDSAYLRSKTNFKKETIPLKTLLF